MSKQSHSGSPPSSTPPPSPRPRASSAPSSAPKANASARRATAPGAALQAVGPCPLCGRRAAEVEVSLGFLKTRICRMCAGTGYNLVQVMKRWLG